MDSDGNERLAINFLTSTNECQLAVELVCDESVLESEAVVGPLAASESCQYQTTLTSRQMCPQFKMRAYTIWLVNMRNVIGGLIIPLGFYLAFFGRRFIRFSNFIVSAIVVGFSCLCVFSSTFMTPDQPSYVGIISYIGVCFAMLLAGVVSSVYIKFGGSIIGGVAGFILGITLNTAWLYMYEILLMTYLVAGILALAVFLQCLILRLAFNQTTVVSTAFIGAYMMIRGAAIYIGYYPNELIMLGEMKRGEREQIEPWFYAWFAGIFVLGAVAAIV